MAQRFDESLFSNPRVTLLKTTSTNWVCGLWIPDLIMKIFPPVSVPTHCLARGDNRTDVARTGFNHYRYTQVIREDGRQRKRTRPVLLLGLWDSALHHGNGWKHCCTGYPLGQHQGTKRASTSHAALAPVGSPLDWWTGRSTKPRNGI